MFGLRNIVKVSSVFAFKNSFQTHNFRYLTTIRSFSSNQNFGSSSVSTGKSPLSNDLASKVNQGLASVQQRDFNNGITHLQEAIQLYTANKDKAFLSGDELGLLLRAYYELGRIYEKHNDITESLKQYNEALEVANKNNISNTLEIGNLFNALGRIQLKQSKLQEAIDYLHKAGGVFMEVEKANKELDIGAQVIENAYMIAVICGNTGQVDKALELLEGILQRYQNEKISEGELDLSLVYQSIGNMKISKGDVTGALEHWNKGFDRAVNKYGEASPQSLNFCMNIIQALIQKARYKEASDYAEKNVSICQKTFDENHPKVAESFLMLGLINFHTGNYDKALQSYMKAAEILSSYPEQYHDQVSFAHMTIAEIYLIQKKEPEARDAFDKALKIAVRALGENHPKVADFYLLWGELLRYKTENIKEARILYSKALDIYKKFGGVDESKLVDIYYNIGVLLHHEGDLSSAMNHLQEGLKMSEKMPSRPRILEDIHNFIGSIWFQQKQYKQSLEHFEKSVELCLQSEKDKKDLDVYYRNLGLANEYNGEAEKAVDWYQKAFESAKAERGQSSEITQTHLKLLTDTLKKINRNEEAENLLKKYS